jgi:hypothetical protein
LDTANYAERAVRVEVVGYRGSFLRSSKIVGKTVADWFSAKGLLIELIEMTIWRIIAVCKLAGNNKQYSTHAHNQTRTSNERNNHTPQFVVIWQQ